jgi:hypothetical protein
MTASEDARRAREANDKLTRALIATARQGLRWYCADAGDLWLSEWEAERAEAVLLCQGCPIIAPCAEVGRFQTFGVFGGRDVTRRQKKAQAA